MLKKGLMTLVMSAALAFSPASALAAGRGGHEGGHGGGGGFSHSARGFSGGEQFRGGLQNLVATVLGTESLRGRLGVGGDHCKQLLTLPCLPVSCQPEKLDRVVRTTWRPRVCAIGTKAGISFPWRVFERTK